VIAFLVFCFAVLCLVMVAIVAVWAVLAIVAIRLCVAIVRSILWLLAGGRR
jgi:hypothetical protein